VSKRKKISFSKKKLWCKTKEQHYRLFGAKEEKKKRKRTYERTCHIAFLMKATAL
jgi:hypothetical protein